MGFGPFPQTSNLEPKTPNLFCTSLAEITNLLSTGQRARGSGSREYRQLFAIVMQEDSTMKKLMLAALGALALLMLFAGPALADTPASNASGAPQINMDIYGYYIWEDTDIVHLRTTDRGNGPDPSVYVGVITANTPIQAVSVFKGEEGDFAVAAGNRLDFHFRTYNRIDGVDFTALGATRITFRLFRDGHLIVTDHIFLGAGQVNPPGNPFTLFV
jgi:hypothetical protein